MVSIANAERTVESAIVDVVTQIAAINEFFIFEIYAAYVYFVNFINKI